MRANVKTLLLAILAWLVWPAADHAYFGETEELIKLQKQVHALRAAGAYQEAIPLAQQLVVRAEGRYQGRPGFIATFLNDLANLYSDQGRYAEAEPLYQRALKIHEQVRGPDHPDVAANLNNLALLYKAQGRYAEAEPLYQRALKITEKARGPEHPDMAASLNNLAVLYKAQGRYAEAEPLHQRALKIDEKTFGPEHYYVAADLNSLATLYSYEGRYAEAEPLYQRSLTIREKARGPDHPVVAASLNALANVYKAQGRYAEAEPLFQRALKIREKALRPDHPDVATSLINLAILYNDQGRYAEAEPLIDRVVTAWDRAGVAPGVRFKGYWVRSEIEWGLNKRPQAIRDLEQALTLAELQRVHGSGGERQGAQSFGALAGAYQRMVAWQQELARPDEALAVIERSRARSLVDQLGAANIDLLAGVPGDEAGALRKREADAKTRLAQLENQTVWTKPDAALEQKLKDAREEVVQTYVAIRNASPAYRQMVGKNYKPATLEEIQSELVGTNGLMLEYLLGEKAGYVVAVPPAGGKARIELLVIDQQQAAKLGVEAGPLTAKHMRTILTNDSSTGILQQLRQGAKAEATLDRLAALWTVLIPEPERKLLSGGKLKRWIVVPDPTLAAFPFETLVVESGENPRYLLDVAPPLVNAPSATLLLNLTDQPGKDSNGVLTVGDAISGGPTSDDSRSANAPATLRAGARYNSLRGELKPLPFTGLESRWVADAFKQAGISTGRLEKANAREASVRMYGPGNKVLHLACHGLVDASYGNLFGALALTPGPQGSADPTDDGYLTLAEIYGLNLQGAELVILSACDTNYGPQQRCEGTWSLSRGFLVAGAKRVVASNWLVDDQAAAKLVSIFCGRVAQGQKGGRLDYAQALQFAKRQIRAQETWQSPYYWGSFILLGPN